MIRTASAPTDRAIGEFGGAEEIRTPDPLNAIQVLFQLSYSPTRVLQA